MEKKKRTIIYVNENPVIETNEFGMKFENSILEEQDIQTIIYANENLFIFSLAWDENR